MNSWQRARSLFRVGAVKIGTRRFRLATLLVLAAVLLPVSIATGIVVGKRQTTILTPPEDSGLPPADGDSDNVTFSQDNRNVRMAAFDTTATNLVQGDNNGKRDVVIFKRSPGEGNLGGSLAIASLNSKGEQANDDSQRPRLDGSSSKAPHCVIFSSVATNLDPRDKTNDVDIFLRDLSKNKTTLVSTKGQGTHADIDNECEVATYAGDNKVWVYDVKTKKNFPIGKGTGPDMQNNGKGVAYERGGQIYYQAFQKVNRIVNKKTGKRGFIWIKIGPETLVSKNKGGQKGNAASANPTMDDNGYYVAFESAATNLCDGDCAGIEADANGATDIFRRTLPKRPGGGGAAPTKDFMEMASYSCGGAKAGDPCAVNAQGNGPSYNAFMTGAGENIVFESQATNLRESTSISAADPNGPIPDIYYWNFPRARLLGNVSRESRTNEDRSQGTGQPFDGPNSKPAASNRANYIAWTSTGGKSVGDRNGSGIADIFIRFLGGSTEGQPTG